jgi:hypothetical protein
MISKAKRNTAGAVGINYMYYILSKPYGLEASLFSDVQGMRMYYSLPTQPSRVLYALTCFTSSVLQSSLMILKKIN